MIYPLLPTFLVRTLGAGPAFLGLIEGVADGLSSVVKLWGGWLADRLGRRKPLVGWGYGIAGVARPLVALAAAPWHVLVVRVVDRIGKGIRTAPRDALLADSVPAGRRGLAFAVHRGADHAGALLGPLVAAALLLALPGRLRLVFALAALPAAVALLVLWRGVRETGSASTSDDPSSGPGREEGEPWCRVEAERGGPAGRRGDPTRPPARLLDLGPQFWRYLAVLFLFTLGNATDAFLLLRAEQLGVSISTLPLLWAVLHLSKVAWSVPGGLLSDRRSPAGVIVAGWLVYAGVYAGFGFADAAWHAWALFVAYGLFHGLTESPERALVASLAPPALRARAFGAYHTAIGVGVLPASLLFGALWEVFGPSVPFLVGAGLAALAAILLPVALIQACGRGG